MPERIQVYLCFHIATVTKTFGWGEHEQMSLGNCYLMYCPQKSGLG
jgi:hypothetical protein